MADARDEVSEMRLLTLVKNVLYTLSLRRQDDDANASRECRFVFRKDKDIWFVEVYQEGALYVKMPIREYRLPSKIREMSSRAATGDGCEFVGVGEYEAMFALTLIPENENQLDGEII